LKVIKKKINKISIFKEELKKVIKEIVIVVFIEQINLINE